MSNVIKSDEQFLNENILKTTNGYQKFSNGLMIQWGGQSVTYGQFVSFPQAFLGAPYSVAVTPQSGSGGSMGQWNNLASTGFNAYVDRHDAANLTEDIRWIAIGIWK